MGQDFNLSQSEVTFELGANDGNTITVFVDVLDDLFVEGTESFTLSGSIGSPSASGSGNTSGQDSDSGSEGSQAAFVGGPVTVAEIQVRKLIQWVHCETLKSIYHEQRLAGSMSAIHFALPFNCLSCSRKEYISAMCNCLLFV